MADNVQTYTTRIFLNSEEAKKRLDELQQKVDELRKKRDAAAKAGDWPTFNSLKKQLDQANNEMSAMQTTAQKIDRVLGNLSTASVKDLQKTIKAINKELSSGAVERGSEEWKFLNEQLKRCKAELKDIRDEGTQQKSMWSRVVDFSNKNWGFFTQLAGAVTGFTITVRRAIQDFADMEEEMADVRKYTGLTADQVRDLNEELKRMDTRTSREELNQLAGAAGRLGLQSKKDILEFVEAADMIGVALGDDLGDGAVDKIGKLAMAFGEDDKKGLKQAMLSTGSALNELAQNSSAQAGYLVEFTARVAGFGKQLGLTQAQIMGFGTVMDENLLKDEMAATAFGNMLTKMQTDTAKFAKIAGMDIKAFTDLLNKDANAAILALADNLKKADPQNMMKMLDDMGLDGSRAVAVLATMADKIDDVRKHQERATEAYENATSVQGEFNTMNNTVQAHLDKCKKRFHEMTVELGEQLLPVVKYTCTGFSLMVNVLSVLAGFVSRNFKLLATLAGGFVYYTTVVSLATNATKIWAAVTKATPWGVAIAGVAALVAVIDHFRTKMDKARESAEELWKTEEKAVLQYDEEARKIQALDKIVRNETISIGQRREALEKLKRIIPDYNGMLDEEGRLTRDNKTAIDDYLVSLQKQIRLKAYQEKLEELYKRQSEQEDAQRTASDNYWNARQANTLQGSRNSMAGKLMDFLGIGEEAGLNRVLNKANQDLADTNQKIDDLQKRIADVGEMAVAIENTESNTGNNATGNNTTAPYKSDAERKKEEEERKKQEAEQKRRLKEAEDAAKAASDAKIATLTHEYAMGEMAYRQYIQRLADLQTEGLRNRRDVYAKGSAEYERLNRQVEERTFKGDQQVNRMKLDDLRRCMQQQQAEIEAQAVRGEITEAESRERLRTLEETYLADVVELYKEGSLERMRAEWELQDVEQRNKLERERDYQQQLEQVREQYLGMGNERQMELALRGLDDLHARGLLKEREYQQAKAAIQAQYARVQTPSEQNSRTANAMLTNAANAVASKVNSNPIVGTIQNYQTLMEKLRELYGQDRENHDAYLLAKQQATSQFCETLASEIQVAYNTINQVMSAASSYFSAQQEYETAQVQKKYEKQIAAAGNNQKKVKSLQEKQQKEEAAIKTKYAKRAATIQMAQAVAQTAINAINAYGSAAAIPVVGYVLAPVAAAMAIAAGALQIATIKKQQQAQEAGYYEGGFTGGRQYRKEAGVVHEGEFVANHQAVNNPAVMPFLNFLDQAQRNNTVGSLTMQDVSRYMGTGGSTQVVTPIVNVQTDNAELRETIEASREATDRLVQRLDEGIEAYSVIDGPNGSYQGHRRYERLINKK